MDSYPLVEKLDKIRANWGWFLVLGIGLIMLGVISLGAAWLTTLASILLFGWLLVFGGTFEVIAAFGAGRWSGTLMHILEGLLYAIGGVMILRHPAASAAGLTLLLVGLFLAGGLFRIISAATLRYQSWGWAVFDGVVTMILGAMIWAAWPSSALWVIGTFVGLALLFRGWSWFMFALGVRKLGEGRYEETPGERFRPAA